MPTLSRAHQAADVHGRAINASRKRAGLKPLSADELTSEFELVNRSSSRTKSATRRTFSNTGAADSMWTAIVGRLNASLPGRAPIAAGRTSESSGAVGRVDASVDWAGICHQLNTEAGLTPPARSAR